LRKIGIKTEIENVTAMGTKGEADVTPRYALRSFRCGPKQVAVHRELFELQEW
jgi:hypothetical protein